MIEDLPLRILKEIGKGGYSPVLPMRVTNENGEVIESRSRLACIRMESGEAVSYTHLDVYKRQIQTLMTCPICRMTRHWKRR